MDSFVPSLSDFRPKPSHRGLAALAATLGVLVCDKPMVLLSGWAGIVFPLCLAAGISRHHLRFTFTIVLPVSLGLFLVWGWLLGAPPGAAPGSAPGAGAHFAALISLRLIALGGIWQLSFLTIPPAELPATLRMWGVPGSLLAVTVGAIALIPEMRLRTEQIITAREARGLVPDRRLWTRALELPKLLRPLLAWALRSAIQRSDLWRERDLLARLSQSEVASTAPKARASALVLALATLWFILSALPSFLRRIG